MRYFQLPDRSIVTEGDAFTISRNVIRVVPASTERDADGDERIVAAAAETAEPTNFSFGANWLASALPADLDRWGIVELAVDAKPDERSNEVTLGDVADGRLHWISRVREVGPLKDAAKARVKAIARQVIVNRYPEWTQANMLARDGELQAVQLGTMRDDTGGLVARRDLTPAEAMEHLAIRNAWIWIKAVRVHSGTLDAEVTALANGDQVVAFEPHNWPA